MHLVTRSPKDFSLPPHAPSLSREELAYWFCERSDMLLRRIRGRVREMRASGLGGPNAASLLDEDDILASVWRRFDEAGVHNRISSGDSAMLWGYVRGVTRRVIQNRLRSGDRGVRLFDSITERERGSMTGIAGAELDRLGPMLRNSLTDDEWELLVLRSRGQDGRGRAAAAGVGESVIRKRWSRVIAVVRSVLSGAVTSSRPPRQQIVSEVETIDWSLLCMTRGGEAS